jgi:uncharacterized protein involved in exopolysaccharide biosynthesis
MTEKNETITINYLKNDNPNSTQNLSDEISIIDLIAILWKNKWIIAICTVLSTVSGIFYALRAPEVFTTDSLFVTKSSQNSGGGNLSQLASLAGISAPSSTGNIDPSDYLDKIIQDKSFLLKLFKRKWNYHGDSVYLDKILQILPDTSIANWQYRFSMAKINTIRNGKLITIIKDSKAGILTLTVNMLDPQLAYDINKYTLDYLSNYIRNSLQTQAKEKRIFIEGRIKETKTELTQSEDALVRFKERNLMTSSPKVMLEEERLTRQVTLNQEIYLQLKKQYELARIQELDDQTLIQVIKNPEIPVHRSSPKKTRIAIISFIFGCLLGITCAIANHFILKLNPVFLNPNQKGSSLQ